MSFVQFLGHLGTVAVIATGIAAVIAVWKYKTEIQEAKKLKWQKTTVQEIVQSVEDRISFLELKTKYKSLAAEKMAKLLDIKDISDESLRMILIDLCRDNVIVQLGSDTYALTTYPGQIEKTQKTNSEMLALQKLFFEAQLKFLGKQDGHMKEMIETQRNALHGSLGRSPISSLGSATITTRGKT